MIVLIDNYDSFVHNLARYLQELGFETKVFRHDALSLSELTALKPSHILISPGPGTPEQAGISVEVIKHLGVTTPILGICLGHQAIGQAYGAKVERARRPMHGKASAIQHNEQDLFKGLENPLKAARYHSLIVSEEAFPACLEVAARCEQGEIMALKHRDYPVYGVQFHPESVLTSGGHALLKNFLLLSRR